MFHFKVANRREYYCTRLFSLYDIKLSPLSDQIPHWENGTFLSLRKNDFDANFVHKKRPFLQVQYQRGEGLLYWVEDGEHSSGALEDFNAKTELRE